MNPSRCTWSSSVRNAARRVVVLGIAAVCFFGTADAQPPQHDKLPRTIDRRLTGGNIARVSEERTGEMTTRDGLRLRVLTDQGDILIKTMSEPSSSETARVTYRVRIETDARTANAREVLKQYILSVHSTPAGVQIVGEMPKGALRERVAGDFPLLPLVRVSYLISVPRDYSLDVLTQAGNIETPDIKGTVTLLTRGGNIIAGRIGLSSARTAPWNPASSGKLQARLETQGGHIFVSDVAGDLRAVTVGGHISAGNINGDAILHSGGGHIRAGEISGKTQIETAGGNISVQHAGGNVTASTTGGQIDFGEASGSVRAHTGGGGIRILHVAGPIQLETSDGSICLTRVQGSVRASTGSGTITAWINPVTAPGAPPGPRGTWRAPLRDATAGAAGDKKVPLAPGQLVRLSAASQLESGQGDIIVFLPRQLAANIEATIEKAADHSIEADPELPLKLISQGSVGSRGGNTIRAEGALNGGGELLRLRTVSGNIRLKYFDADPALHEMLIRQQKTRLDRQKKIIERRVTFVRATQNEQKDPHAAEPEQTLDSDHTGETDSSAAAPEAPTAPRGEDSERAGRNSGLFEQLGRQLEMKVWGGVKVSADELQTHLISSVKPLYPELAKRTGIDGTVQLEIQVNKDGTVEVRKALAGEQLLVNAAIVAVKQWRYRPVVLAGKPVNAISTVALEFRLR
ncbi:MAG TPA: TonB family protein [Candidatus Dormibacteraeota bacterium]|nr:TonB family protein [Candidatus Dormibacteraeota bacterium]